jgi:transposase
VTVPGESIVARGESHPATVLTLGEVGTMEKNSHGGRDAARCPVCGNLTGRAGLERRRSDALEMHANGLSASMIAEQFGVTRNAVYYWIRRYGLDGALLQRKRRGRHPTLGATEVKRLRSLMQRNPRAYGIAGTDWTGSTVVALVEKFFDVRLSIGLARTLKKRLTTRAH